jgi:hypothetical protein
VPGAAANLGNLRRSARREFSPLSHCLPRHNGRSGGPTLPVCPQERLLRRRGYFSAVLLIFARMLAYPGMRRLTVSDPLNRSLVEFEYDDEDEED